jgi:hypothetical protein
MALIKKQIEVEAQIGDQVKAPKTIFRSDLTLYICHIEGDLLYVSPISSADKDDCETSFVDDCYLI